MSEIKRLAQIMSDAAWDAGPFDATAGVRAILTAMREKVATSSERTEFFDEKTGDLFDSGWECPTCGGHGFAVRAYLDHILSEPDK